MIYLSCTPSTWAKEPADLHNLPPAPGFNSILWIEVPVGIFLIFIAFPELISAFEDEITLSPDLISDGAMMYSFKSW